MMYCATGLVNSIRMLQQRINELVGCMMAASNSGGIHHRRRCRRRRRAEDFVAEVWPKRRGDVGLWERIIT